MKSLSKCIAQSGANLLPLFLILEIMCTYAFREKKKGCDSLLCHSHLYAGRTLLIQMVLQWWKTSIQKWWISPWLHSEIASKPTGQTVPWFKPCLSCWSCMRMKSKQWSHCLPYLLSAPFPKPCGRWADVNRTAVLWVFFLVCVLSHVKELQAWVFVIAFD